MISPQIFAGIFTTDSALLRFTQSALRIYCACLLLFGIQIACQMAFTSFGKAKASIAVAVTRKFILLLPLIYLLPHIWTANQTNAVYLAEPIADFIAVSFTSILFAFQFKKGLKGIKSVNLRHQATQKMSRANNSRHFLIILLFHFSYPNFYY